MSTDWSITVTRRTLIFKNQKKKRKKDKMMGKVTKTLQNDFLYCFVAYRKNLGKIHWNDNHIKLMFDDNHSIIIDVLDQNSPSSGSTQFSFRLNFYFYFFS